MKELRVLTSTEQFTHPYYCQHPCFLSLSQTFKNAETHFFAMSIESSSIYRDFKNKEAIKFEA